MYMTRFVRIWSLLIVATMILLTAGCAQKSTPASGAGTQIGATGPSAEEIRAREEEERRRRIAESQLAGRPSSVTPGTQLMDTVYFEFDQATLSDLAKETLVRNAEWLRSNTDARVQVEGNADDPPQGNCAGIASHAQRPPEERKGFLMQGGRAGGQREFKDRKRPVYRRRQYD